MASPILDKRQRLLVAQTLRERAKKESGRAGYCKSMTGSWRTPESNAAWLNERQQHLDTAAELRSLAAEFEAASDE